MTYILAIDTTLGACSAALLKDGKIIVDRQEIRNRGHVERLLPMLGEMCEDAAVDLKDINYIAVTIGPGTFAGVRIGLSAAKGMGLALNIPIIPITTLEALAFSYSRKNTNYSGRLAVAIDARRGEIYLQSFELDCGKTTALNDPQAVPLKWVQEKLAYDVSVIIGSGCALSTEVQLKAIEGYDYPSASYVAQLASQHIERAQICDNVSPLYLRKPDAKLPKAITVTVADD